MNVVLSETVLQHKQRTDGTSCFLKTGQVAGDRRLSLYGLTNQIHGLTVQSSRWKTVSIWACLFWNWKRKAPFNVIVQTKKKRGRKLKRTFIVSIVVLTWYCSFLYKRKKKTFSTMGLYAVCSALIFLILCDKISGCEDEARRQEERWQVLGNYSWFFPLSFPDNLCNAKPWPFFTFRFTRLLTYP